MDVPENFVYHDGDMFTSSMPALGHGVNTQGLMGAGVAVPMKNRYLDMYKKYRELCLEGKFLPGMVFPYHADDGKWVFNLATQDRIGPHARLEWVETTFRKTLDFMVERNIEGIALPRIGSGYGALRWPEVEVLIFEQVIAHPSVQVEVWVQ